MTALYDAIEEGLTHLKEAQREKKVLIVISDGGDNASRHKFTRVLKDAERSDVIIYTIGLFDEHDGDHNPGVLRKLASATGGEVFLPKESGSVVPICERIAADIRHQYTIGYVPTNQKRDNTYRSIRVTAARPNSGKLFLRTRDGYIASTDRKDRKPPGSER
jgi:VWFA-related protein